MKIAYITGEISHNGHFSFFHDLLTNYPTPDPSWCHRLYLVQPTWDRNLIANLKERGVDVRACFEDFQPTMDVYWEKIKEDTSDCDVIISGNITNLDEILHDNINIPIVSFSLAEKGYRSPTGGYGTFYKPRFNKAAVCRTAVDVFPDHVRNEVSILYRGIDPARLSQGLQRETTRNNWFPTMADTIKIALFIGIHRDSKGFKKLVDSLDYLPDDWHVLVISIPRELSIPDHLRRRVHLVNPTYKIADIFLACDCFVLPTEHEGLNSALLEAWFLEVPVVTTRHKSMLELMAKHGDTNFGNLVDVDVEPKELAQAIQSSEKSDTASKCMYQHYMASNMVDSWQSYLEGLNHQ